MPQAPVARPLGEADLGDELGPTQVMCRSRISSANGDVSRTSGASCWARSRSVAWVKPVPTLPA